MAVLINYGPSNFVEKQVTAYTDLSQILSDKNVKTFLGVPENVELFVDGVSMSNGPLRDGMDIHFITKSNSKA